MANDIYEVKLFWADQDGKRSENVLNYQAEAAPGPTDPFVVANDVATAFLTANLAGILACVSTDVTLLAITCRRVNNAGGPTYSSIVASNGSRTGETMTNAVAVNLCLIPNAPPYQRKEGHLYLGGIVASDVVGDVIQNALTVLLTALRNLLLTALVTAGTSFELVILDRSTKIGQQIADIVQRNVITPLRRRLKPRQST